MTFETFVRRAKQIAKLKRSNTTVVDALYVAISTLLDRIDNLAPLQYNPSVSHDPQVRRDEHKQADSIVDVLVH